jgi:RNA polymerase sigma-70 factor (ECF subfamily)
MLTAGSKQPAVIKLDYANTHRDIVEACKQGDRQAQFELYRLYGKAMYNVCLRMVKNETDAEDLLQNSFVDIFTKLDSFRFQSSIGAWIKRIVINNCINFLKKRRIQLEELDVERHDHSSPATTPPVQIGLNVEVIKKAMLELPDGYRVVFTLYLLEGYDHKEIGEILGVTEATSKSQYSRARRKLQDIINSRKQSSNF